MTYLENPQPPPAPVIEDEEKFLGKTIMNLTEGFRLSCEKQQRVTARADFKLGTIMGIEVVLSLKYQKPGSKIIV